jgi:ADP-L-glycero-D-manno-heptose 6-epimerase
MDTWALNQKKCPPAWAGFRFFNVYGPNEYHKDAMASVAYKAFLQIKKTGQLKLFKSENSNYKDGFQMRDFVYVKDITRWLIEAWQNKKLNPGIYNLGFGEARTWLDLATLVFAAMDTKVNIDWIDMPANLKEQYQYFTEAKMDKAFLSGLSQPQWSLEKGVSDYIRNYLEKDNPYA